MNIRRLAAGLIGLTVAFGGVTACTTAQPTQTYDDGGYDDDGFDFDSGHHKKSHKSSSTHSGTKSKKKRK